MAGARMLRPGLSARERTPNPAPRLASGTCSLLPHLRLVIQVQAQAQVAVGGQLGQRGVAGLQERGGWLGECAERPGPAACAPV